VTGKGRENEEPNDEKKERKRKETRYQDRNKRISRKKKSIEGKQK
jgi:hypothetical protein